MLQQKIAIHQKLLQQMEYAEPVEKSPARQISQLPYWRQNIVHMNQTPHMNDIPHMNEIRHMNDISHMNDLPVMGVDNPPPFYVEYEVLDNLDKENSNERQPKQRNNRDDRRHTHAIDPATHTERQYHQESGHALLNLPSGSSNPQRSGGRPQNDRADFLHSPTFDDLDGEQQKPHKGVFQLPNQRRVKKERVLTTPTQIEQMWQGIVAHHQVQQKELMHKINAVDCRVLLDMCSVKYGLSASDFNISINPYGNDRIQVENKTLNAAEFLQQYMNLSHKESGEMIENTLQQQKIGFRQRSPVSGLMWARFNREEATALRDFQMLRQKYRADKQKVFDRNRFTKNPNETKAQSVVRRKFINQKRDYELSQLQEQYRPLFKEQKKPNERYLEWLHKQSVSGSLNALCELQRVYPHYKDRIDENSRQWLAFQSKGDEIPYQTRHAPDFGLSVFIHKNGTIDYRDESGKTLISNAYNAVIVKEKTAENIAKALQIAQAKFGKNGFEIVNASLRDMA
ncbi:MAG: hypothetical protein IJV56_09310, partial [Neisseriaceae bacterium]|nr:hypothetical protein [Neisseriaceae bacterium]